MKTSYLLLLNLFIATASPAVARDRDAVAPRLTLQAVTDAVLANNPAIKEALAKWDAARKRIPQEAAWDDLRVSAMSRVARFVAIQPNGFTDQSISLEQAIPVSGKNRSRTRIAVADAKAAFEAARRQQLDVVTKARVAYFQLANAYQQRELNEKNIVSLRQIAEIGRSKYEFGRQTAAEVLAAETETSKLLESRRDIENTIAANQSALNVMMNRDAFAALDEPVSVVVTSRVPVTAELRSILLRRRPEMIMARAAVEAQSAMVELARRAWIPDPSITVQSQRYNDAAQAVSELGAGISFSVPWGNARKYSAGVTEARDHLTAAQFDLERTEKEAIGLLRDALERVETSRHHVELFHDQLVPQARQSFEANEFAYQSGKTGFGDWIGAERNLRDLEMIGRQHLADYQSALVELESVVGADLGIFRTPKKKPND
jgi:cobalt-zinc-cadmium efflux system outer membrane protein